MTLDLEGQIWRFALDFYGQPGIAPACLALQDEADLDVIQLLLLLYADTVLGRPLGAEDISAARAAMAGWRQAAVLPIRQIRRALKHERSEVSQSERQSLRTQVKAAELLAERIQLAIAERWLRERRAGSGLPLDAALTALLTFRGDHARDDGTIGPALRLIASTAERLRLERHG